MKCLQCHSKEIVKNVRAVVVDGNYTSDIK